MKLKIVVSIFMASVLALPAFAQDDEPPSPEKTAAHFIAAYFNVKPEQVNVTITKREKLSATATTSGAGLPNCTLDMAPAPTAHPQYGWLIGGLACGKEISKGEG